jgi:MarR family 2-MHQ and catechol resistance regulon transcriptional repressor
LERKEAILDSVVKDLLAITPLIRRNLQRKLMRTAFAQIEADLTLPHLEIIKILREEGRKHIAEIGEKLQMPKPQMTYLIDRLEKLEIVARQADAADRRITNITLTDKGKAVTGELDRAVMSSIRDRLAGLTGGELRELSASLRKLGEILTKLP